MEQKSRETAVVIRLSVNFEYVLKIEFYITFAMIFFQLLKTENANFLKFRFSEKATKICAILLMVLTFTK